MDYPYINLDLLKEYAVFFHGDIGKWAATMQHAVDAYDGEKSLQCYMCWDGDISSYHYRGIDRNVKSVRWL